MGLNYKILWVDDDIENYEAAGQIENIRKYLRDLGFNPIIDTYEDTSNAWKNVQAKKYDLIISDYNISDEADGNGDMLIAKIRKGEIYTEVLFYSNRRNFDSVAQKLYQDRVTCCSIDGQNGFEKLEERTKALIDLTLNKLHEIENLRGLVMAETSQNDALMNEILEAYFDLNNNNAAKLRNKILKDMLGSIRGNLIIAEEFRKSFRDNVKLKVESKKSKQLISEPSFSADHKTRAINAIIGYDQLDSANSEYADFYNKYKRDVLGTRNELAHAKSIIDDDGEEYLVVSRKDDEGEIIKENVKFSRDEIIELRKALLNYHRTLSKLHEKIKNMAS